MYVNNFVNKRIIFLYLFIFKLVNDHVCNRMNELPRHFNLSLLLSHYSLYLSLIIMSTKLVTI